MRTEPMFILLRNPAWPIVASTIYAANGCVYCHSQQVRADYAGSDIERKWGDRRSAPRDYIFERPVQLGKMSMGPDLANIGKRAPADEQNAGAAGAPGAAVPGANPTAASCSAVGFSGCSSGSRCCFANSGDRRANCKRYSRGNPNGCRSGSRQA